MKLTRSWLALVCLVAFVSLNAFDATLSAQTTTQKKAVQKKSEAQTQEKPAAEKAADDKATPAEAQSPGIAIGEKIPEITLPKQDGTEVSIQTMLKKGPVAMVFYRSASW